SPSVWRSPCRRSSRATCPRVAPRHSIPSKRSARNKRKAGRTGNRPSTFVVRHSPLPAGFALSAAVPASASAAIVASTATAAASPPPAAEPAFRLGARLVHHERAAFHLVLVELVDGLLRVIIARHLDEGESACPARRHVPHHTNAVDLSRPAKEFRE